MKAKGCNWETQTAVSLDNNTKEQQFCDYDFVKPIAAKPTAKVSATAGVKKQAGKKRNAAPVAV